MCTFEQEAIMQAKTWTLAMLSNKIHEGTKISVICICMFDLINPSKVTVMEVKRCFRLHKASTTKMSFPALSWIVNVDSFR